LNPSSHSRRHQIDTLRGIACILLVAFHVVGVSPATGLEISGGLIRQINDGLACLRLPLFTLLSGYVYAMRPVTAGARWRFLKGKVRRLLVPLIVVAPLFLLSQSVVPGTNRPLAGSAMLLDLLHPQNLYWYLQALFLIFVLIALVEPTGVLQQRRGALIAFALAFALAAVPIDLPWFSFSGALYLLPFFMVGLIASRYCPGAPDRWRWLGIIGVVIFAAATPALGRHGYPAHDLPVLAISVAAGVMLWLSRPEWAPIAWLGTHSYAIYLFHVFFTAAMRIALHHCGISTIAVHLPLGVAAGLAGSVAISLLARRHAPTRLLLLGMPLAARDPRR